MNNIGTDQRVQVLADDDHAPGCRNVARYSSGLRHTLDVIAIAQPVWVRNRVLMAEDKIEAACRRLAAPFPDN